MDTQHYRHVDRYCRKHRGAHTYTLTSSDYWWVCFSRLQLRGGCVLKGVAEKNCRMVTVNSTQRERKHPCRHTEQSRRIARRFIRRFSPSISLINNLTFVLIKMGRFRPNGFSRRLGVTLQQPAPIRHTIPSIHTPGLSHAHLSRPPSAHSTFLCPP